MIQKLRAAQYLWLAILLNAGWLDAQIAEPILTKSAIPYAAGAGGIKLDYAGGLGSSGGSTQVIPEAIVEQGVGGGLELVLRFPLLRLSEGDGATTIGGGQLALGARQLLVGEPSGPFALSLQAVVEAPTGDTRIVGDAAQVMPALLLEWRPRNRVAAYTNLTYDRSFGPTRSPASFLEYAAALSWQVRTHWIPTLELVGSTNTLTMRTQMVTQPEMILRVGTHLEWKAGLQLGLTSNAPPLGLRIQLAAFWGKRD